MKTICYPSYPKSKATKTSDLFQLLVVLKCLHGTRHGCKGSTADDITMYLVKHFGIDGDVKSQVYQLLKYGVRRNYIYKKKGRYGIITPISAVHTYPFKCKEDAIEQAKCIFPSSWYKTTCNRKEEPCQKIACVKGKKYTVDPYNNPEEVCESCKPKSNCFGYMSSRNWSQPQQPQRQGHSEALLRGTCSQCNAKPDNFLNSSPTSNNENLTFGIHSCSACRRR